MLTSNFVKQHGADAKIKDKAAWISTNIRNELLVVISPNPDEIITHT